MHVEKAIPNKGKWMVWVFFPNNPPSHMADIYIDDLTTLPDSVLKMNIKNSYRQDGWLTVIKTESNERKV